LVPIGGREVNDSLKVRMVNSIQRATGCQVTLMTIVTPDATAAQRKVADTNLQRAAKIYGINGVGMVTGEAEQPAAAIIEQAADHDLLILGMREEPWLRSFFFGTVAQQVAGQVACPTLLVKAYQPDRARVRRLLRIM
jgi:nucleotide-binding universal stress UspA family protein